MKYVTYCRVSTDKQGVLGLGMDAQRDAVEAHCRRSDGEIIAAYIEAESGKSHTNRPQLAAALTHCKKVGAVLLIAKLDRLARNVAFISALMESGVEFIAADMPTANRLTIHILAAVAEHERAIISTRIKDALASINRKIAADGVYTTKSGKQIKYLGGFKGVGTITPEKQAAAPATRQANATDRNAAAIQAVRLIRSFQPNASLRQIALRLTREGITPPRGGEWTAVQIKRIEDKLK